MSEPLDLTEAIEATKAWALRNLNGYRTHWIDDEDITDIIQAAAPVIERAVREQAARELIAWAEENHDRSLSGPRAVRRRHLQAAARKIAPKVTTEEIVQALRDGNYAACYLDEAGRPVARDE